MEILYTGIIVFGIFALFISIMASMRCLCNNYNSNNYDAIINEKNEMYF